MIDKLKSLGPGLLYAGAAIGVSHLVQSTQAGAYYGYLFIVAIVIIHVLKYPFFALGPRYANKTNTSLVAGYASLGRWATVVLGILTLTTMFFIQAAITIVTAGLVQRLTGINIDAWQWGILLLIICLLILRIGRFKVLDQIIKVVVLALAVSTLIACFTSFKVGTPHFAGWLDAFSLTNTTDTNFLIAFLGWMPAPLDIAIWHSVWSISNYAIKKKPSFESENFDFNIGFFGTAILGICFLILGANVMNAQGIVPHTGAGAFAQQLIDMFTAALGDTFYLVILVSAFATMFSTTLTALDAIPRVLVELSRELSILTKKSLAFWQAFLAIGTGVVLVFFVENMKQMVTFATTVSFLATPILAYMGYRLAKKRKDLNLWNTAEFNMARIGIVVVTLLSLSFIVLMASDMILG